MIWQIVFSILIVAISSFLWRVRGGLDIWKGDNVPMNKIWYAVASGFQYGNGRINMRLLIDGVNQVFRQADYITRN